jgi:septal ring factor EnvC (AmiA/AmiB activator)
MNKGILISISMLLAVALITLGVFYGMGVGELNKANIRITALEANIASLQDQYTTEKIIADSLQTRLSAANGNITNLQTNMDTANAKVTSLQTDLATANAKVTSLTADLATANGKVTTTQASLDKANADLAVAKTTNTSLFAELTKVENPSHFNSVQELAGWLAQDDTNTNPAYSSLTTAAKAYVLQVKALRDGHLLPAQIVPDSTGTYILGFNLALVSANIYAVDPSTDAINPYPFSFVTALPLYPLSLP